MHVASVLHTLRMQPRHKSMIKTTIKSLKLPINKLKMVIVCRKYLYNCQLWTVEERWWVLSRIYRLCYFIIVCTGWSATETASHCQIINKSFVFPKPFYGNLCKCFCDVSLSLFHVFSYKCIKRTYFTLIAASRPVTDDIINYNSSRIFITNLQYYYVYFILIIDKKSSLIDWF